jgi:large subunit ribosomal protein L2
MALKKYNPVTPGTRQLVLVDRSHLWKGKPEKSLVVGKSKTGGRNNLVGLLLLKRVVVISVS